VGHALLTGVWPRNPWTRAYRADESQPGERTVGWLSGSCVLLRRSAFDAVGGFDEGYFMYFEDVDLGFRLGRAGWSNLYVPSARVVHTGAHSTATESARMLKAHHDSAYRYLQKKYPGALLAPLRWSLRLGLTVRSRIVTMRVERAQKRSAQAQAPSSPSR
jgi:N-acetylglucosaminyl-diphospho-decaprenol L-rhamnosyltransferase